MGLELRYWRQGQWGYRSGKVLRQPVDGRFEVQAVQMDDQVDGATATPATVPVHELGAGDREHARCGMPFVFVVWIALTAAQRQDQFQGNGPELIGLLPPLPEGHGSAQGSATLGTQTQPFMLMTWLFSVSRSMRAAVR